MQSDKGTEQNEVTLFGADYDGAISASDGRWKCDDCNCMNPAHVFVCIFCDYEAD